VSDEERDIFRRVRWLDTWQAHGRVEGMPKALLIDRNHRFTKLGHPVIMFRYWEDSNLYYFFGYADATQSNFQLIRNLQADIASVHGQSVGSFGFVRWKYFPHFSSEDVASGYHGRLERLQGQRRTLYVGELLSLIGVESAAVHAKQLIERHWGPESTRSRQGALLREENPAGGPVAA
jgi:hypothetical protein